MASSDPQTTPHSKHQTEKEKMKATELASSKRSQKRPLEDDDQGSKHSKKPAPFTRLFSEKDELEILDTLAKEFGPNCDKDEFYNYVVDKLESTVSKKQLTEKLKKLRRKYAEIKNKINGRYKKGKGLGEHDFCVYKLGDMIWGGEEQKLIQWHGDSGGEGSGGGGGGGEEQKLIQWHGDSGDEGSGGGREEESSGARAEFLGKYKYLALSLESRGGLAMPKFLKDNVMLIGEEKAEEFDKLWKDLFMKELEVLQKKLACCMKAMAHMP